MPKPTLKPTRRIANNPFTTRTRDPGLRSPLTDTKHGPRDNVRAWRDAHNGIDHLEAPHD